MKNPDPDYSDAAWLMLPSGKFKHCLATFRFLMDAVMMLTRDATRYVVASEKSWELLQREASWQFFREKFVASPGENGEGVEIRYVGGFCE